MFFLFFFNCGGDNLMMELVKGVWGNNGINVIDIFGFFNGVEGSLWQWQNDWQEAGFTYLHKQLVE